MKSKTLVVIIIAAILSVPALAQEPYPYRALDPRQFDRLSTRISICM